MEWLIPKVHRPSTDAQFGTLYQGVDLENSFALKSFSAIFQLRRLVFAWLCHEMVWSPYFQIASFLLSMEFYIIYLNSVQPQDSSF